MSAEAAAFGALMALIGFLLGFVVRDQMEFNRRQRELEASIANWPPLPRALPDPPPPLRPPDPGKLRRKS